MQGSKEILGGKGFNLKRLEKSGFNVPRWMVIPVSFFHEYSSDDVPKLLEGIDQKVTEHFGECLTSSTYAVRSSALNEDGAQFSFAGMFETFLHVSHDQVNRKVLEVWESAFSDRIKAYTTQHKLEPVTGLSVIIQEMVEADVSGVSFGADPVSGDDIHVVSAVYGLGEGLVSGDLTADTYTVNDDEIHHDITQKVFAYRCVQDSTVSKVSVENHLQSLPCLSDQQIREVSGVQDQLTQELGSPQDIEFAYKDNTLYLLQTRPVTTGQATEEGEYIVWDNSNIIESYPGITTPLTFSFIIKMYEMVYRQFVGLLGVREKEINQYQHVFSNTLGLVRGRVYYNLLSWYKMLAMVPGYSLNARFMETMMGVKERFELKENFRMNKGLAWYRIILMVIKMLWLQMRLPRERKVFIQYLDQIITEYRDIDFSGLSLSETLSYYKRFEREVLLAWKAPLINDFFAMIWFGVMQKQVNKLCPDQPNLHNDLLCGSHDIISVEPIHRTMSIADFVCQDENLKKLFIEEDSSEIWDRISREVDLRPIHSQIKEYIHHFGDRCMGELKLETVSYTQDPTLFIKILKSYVKHGITENTQHNLDQKLRSEAEEYLASKVGKNPIKKWWIRFVIKKARDLVSNRENLRYERTRAFGMVRKMFLSIGEFLYQKQGLDDPRHIFYLELEEIKSLDLLDDVNWAREAVKKRKTEFESYRLQKVPEQRFYTYGHRFEDRFIYSQEKLEPITGDLKGVGCCPGRVSGRVQVVTDPNDIQSLDGDILVTSSTDPGWVTLFPTASAILVERGSLLSHSAIVSREMGIPCIVSINDLLRTLKTGDIVTLDGSTGEIQISSDSPSSSSNN